MTTNDATRAALVDKAELADRIAALITLRTQWSPIDRALEIIDTVLADRAVPEPDADAVERAARAMFDFEGELLYGDNGKWDKAVEKGFTAVDYYRDMAAAALQAAAVPTVQAAAERTYTLADMMREYQRGFRDSEAITVQAAAGDDLDAMLRHLTDGDLPGKTLSIYRHDGQWGAQQHMAHLEEQYPTDVCGHGDGVLEAIADAVAKARTEQAT